MVLILLCAVGGPCACLVHCALDARMQAHAHMHGMHGMVDHDTVPVQGPECGFADHHALAQLALTIGILTAVSLLLHLGLVGVLAQPSTPLLHIWYPPPLLEPPRL